MKKIVLTTLMFCFLSAAGVQAKVLVIAEYYYYTYAENSTFVNQYISDVQKIDFKKVDLFVINVIGSSSVRDRCVQVWDTIRYAYQNSLPTGDTLEGVVLVGNLPKAWRADFSWGDEEDIPDDRYFMDIYDTIAHACYSSDAIVWDFDGVKNLFTTYHSFDNYLDVWVSRIMADPIRGLRNGPTDVMDEYTIINNYFIRLHERMTMPAKVPSRGFVMGGITEWSGHDPVTKFDFTDLNLRSVFSFDYPDNRPANWLLQLIWGPRGGTSLGAFNGVRYENIGTNSITITYSLLHNFKNGVDTSIGTYDTMGYEWAGINEHSIFQCHNFNQAPDEMTTPYGAFWDITQGKQWNYVWNTFDTSYYNNYAYVYNPLYDPNPYNAICGKQQHAIFKMRVPAGGAGVYHIFMHYPAASTNCSYVYGVINSYPSNNNFLPWESIPWNSTWTFGLGNPPPLMQIDQRTHLHTDGVPNSNWEEIGADAGGNCNGFICNNGDSVWVRLMNDGGNLIADAVKFVGPGGEIIVDNLDPRFASDNWYDRGFLDMQDEDPVYHAAYSKVPFFVSSGCEVGNYMGCYNPNDYYRYSLTDIISNDLGLLYGMAHSGLISLTSATSYPSYQGSPFIPFTTTLAAKDINGQPNTFGNGMLHQANAYLSIPYVFIGAGTLRADSSAYVPYGTQEIKFIDLQVSNTISYNYPGNLIWFENFHVTSSGNCTINGKEIRIYAESDLKGEVHITASN